MQEVKAVFCQFASSLKEVILHFSICMIFLLASAKSVILHLSGEGISLMIYPYRLKHQRRTCVDENIVKLPWCHKLHNELITSVLVVCDKLSTTWSDLGGNCFVLSPQSTAEPVLSVSPVYLLKCYFSETKLDIIAVSTIYIGIVIMIMICTMIIMMRSLL